VKEHLFTINGCELINGVCFSRSLVGLDGPTLGCGNLPLGED